MFFIFDNKNIVLSMWKATIHDRFTPKWCLIAVIRYSINKIIFYVHFDLISNTPPVRKKRQIACSSVTNRARREFKKAKWSLGKTDLGGYISQKCIYDRFSKKSGCA